MMHYFRVGLSLAWCFIALCCNHNAFLYWDGRRYRTIDMLKASSEAQRLGFNVHIHLQRIADGDAAATAQCASIAYRVFTLPRGALSREEAAGLFSRLICFVVKRQESLPIK